MGKIEEAILENYKKALQDGNLNQAKVSVHLAKTLRTLIEDEGFTDYDLNGSNSVHVRGDFFQPFPYRYYPSSGVVVIQNSAINLTNSENKLFYLLSQNESHGEKIMIITQKELKNFLWNGRAVTNNALRILIKRLRGKIEHDPANPQIILSYNKKGYIFVGIRINESEEE